MALLNMREVNPGVSLGLWQIEETVDDFFVRFPWMVRYKEDLEQYKSVDRKLEYLAVRALLRELLKFLGMEERQIDSVGNIGHNKIGKPLLRGFNISISHTKGYAAVILSRKKIVAVDIEYYNDRVKRIASKFLRKDEKAFDLDSLLLHWCGKETVYKLFSEQKLVYQDMRVGSFDAMSDWFFVVENLRTSERVNVDYELTMDFVLTYSSL